MNTLDYNLYSPSCSLCNHASLVLFAKATASKPTCMVSKLRIALKTVYPLLKYTIFNYERYFKPTVSPLKGKSWLLNQVIYLRSKCLFFNFRMIKLTKTPILPNCQVPNGFFVYSGGSCLMRISLLRFFKTFHKCLA